MMVEIRKSVPLTLARRRLINRTVRVARQYVPRLQRGVAIILVGERAMQALNRRSRGLNRPTDVLTYAWAEERRVKSAALGEIYLCPAIIRRQARAFGVKADAEFIRSLAHGLLHAAGYDHQGVREAARMFKVQELIVNQVRLHNLSIVVN